MAPTLSHRSTLCRSYGFLLMASLLPLLPFLTVICSITRKCVRNTSALPMALTADRQRNGGARDRDRGAWGPAPGSCSLDAPRPGDACSPLLPPGGTDRDRLVLSSSSRVSDWASGLSERDLYQEAPVTTHVNYIPQSSRHSKVDTFSAIWVTSVSSRVWSG